MSVIVTAIFSPAEGKIDELVEALRLSIPAVHEEEGCDLYAIHKAPNGQIVMIEKWESAELLDAHGAGDAVRALNARIDGLLAAPVEVTRLVAIPVGTPAQGTI
jgi:quinol monooxygenase YgiN